MQLTDASVLATNSNGLIVEGEFPDYTDVYLSKVNNDTKLLEISLLKNIKTQRWYVGSSDQANLYIQVGDTNQLHFTLEVILLQLVLVTIQPIQFIKRYHSPGFQLIKKIEMDIR